MAWLVRKVSRMTMGNIRLDSMNIENIIDNEESLLKDHEDKAPHKLHWKERPFKFFVSSLKEQLRFHVARPARPRDDHPDGGIIAPFRVKSGSRPMSSDIITRDTFERTFNRFILILGEQMELEFDGGMDGFPLSDEKGIWIHYKYDGLPVKNKMPHQGNKVAFSKAAIFDDEHPEPSRALDFMISYMDEAPVPLRNLSFIEEEKAMEVKEQLNELLAGFLELKKKIIEDSKLVLEEEFEDEGEFFDDNINLWLRDNFGFFEHEPPEQ